MSTKTPPYILIVGHGRSGTNWLLDILDASPNTHCRNEPDETANSSLEYMKSLRFSEKALEYVTDNWEERVNLSRISMSERDHHIDTSKNHIYALSQKTGLVSLPVRPKIKRALRIFVPNLWKGEWPVPWWISNRSDLENSCTILKMNMLFASFVNWHLEKYPHIPVLHIVRHPCGYLNSSINRFFSKCSLVKISQEYDLYQAMLHTTILNAPNWTKHLGELETMDLFETVIWFWRLNNEIINLFGRSYPNYRVVVYEKIVINPLINSKKIYDFCGLEWTEKIKTIITKGLKKSVWGDLSIDPIDNAEAWKKQLKPEYIDLTLKIMSNSHMISWWMN